MAFLIKALWGSSRCTQIAAFSILPLAAEGVLSGDDAPASTALKFFVQAT
jgi:hypothetical protein